jgi:hypothetical protein
VRLHALISEAPEHAFRLSLAKEDRAYSVGELSRFSLETAFLKELLSELMPATSTGRL